MLTIRLQRAGKRNSPQYKVVLAQKTAANQKQFVEVLGAYNPHTKELGIRDNERLNYWMNEQHVELSPTVHNLFVTKELVKADKRKSFSLPKKEVVAEEAAPEAPVETPSEAPAETPSEEVVTEAPSEAPAAEPAVAESPAEEVAPEAPSEAPAEVPAVEEKA